MRNTPEFSFPVVDGMVAVEHVRYLRDDTKKEIDALHKRLRVACAALEWINRELLDSFDAKAIQKYAAAKIAELQRPLL